MSDPSAAERPMAATAGCAVDGRIWRDGELISDSVALADVDRVVADVDQLVWVDLVRPSKADLVTLADEIGLSPAALEDAVAPFERPKVTRHDTHMFFQAYATRFDGDDLTLSRVSGFVLRNALITVRLDDDLPMDKVLRAWSDDASLLRIGPAALVHGLLDVVVDGHFDAIQQLDDQVEDLEDQLFEQNRTNHTYLREVYRLRKNLVRLRRVVLPMREVVNGLLRHQRDNHDELTPWLDDLYDHVLRAAEWTESLRDMVTSIFETNLSLQDARLNEVMKKLASWAAIIAVPTAITGWFGQNIPYPGFGHVSGLIASVILIVLGSGLLYLLFRRQDWL